MILMSELSTVCYIYFQNGDLLYESEILWEVNGRGLKNRGLC